MTRICELFKSIQEEDFLSAGCFPPKLYKQERDWTCSIACIRTILSGVIDTVPSEDYFISKYNLKPSPYYTKDIKDLKMLDSFKNVIYGIDIDNDDLNLKYIQNLLKRNYFIMAECSYNCAHWIVIIGYCAVKDSCDIEKHQLIVYDPYYDSIRMLVAHEFFVMWNDNSGHLKEFIAIKK